MRRNLYNSLGDRISGAFKVSDLNICQLFDLITTIRTRLTKKSANSEGWIIVKDGNFYISPLTIKSPAYLRTKIPAWIARNEDKLIYVDEDAIFVHDDNAYYEFVKMFYQFIKLPDGSLYPLNRIISRI